MFFMASRTKSVRHRCFFSDMEEDVLLHISSFKSSGKGIVKSVQRENQSHSYHTKLAVSVLAPSNIIHSHRGSGDQATEIKSSSDTKTIGNASSEQAIRAIGYQSNSETTVKILNASLRESTRTEYSIHMR